MNPTIYSASHKRLPQHTDKLPSKREELHANHEQAKNSSKQTKNLILSLYFCFHPSLQTQRASMAQLPAIILVLTLLLYPYNQFYQTLEAETNRSMPNQQTNDKLQPTTPNSPENPIPSSSPIPQVQIDQTPTTEQIVENFSHQVQTDDLSSDEDSMVSFESTILDQHLLITHLQIKKMTNVLIGTIKFDLLKDCRQPEIYAERPTFQEYLDWDFSIVKKDEVPFLKALLVFSKNSNKFLQEIFDASPQLLVHELVFITYQAMKSIWPIHGLNDQINQFQQLARHPLFIRMICDHPQLHLLSYSHVFSNEERYHEEIRQKVAAFLEFYILTCLLVFENYFINPYHQKITKTSKIERQRIYRRKFIGKERKDQKMRKNQRKK